MMEKFLQYVSTFRPDFRARLRGAEPSRIRELSDRTGGALPAQYREFLAAMGDDDAGFHLNHPASTELSRVLAYYTELPREDRPEGLLLFAVDGYGVPDLGMVVDPRKGTPLSIYRWEVDEPWVLRSESFEKLLYQEAFARYRMSMESPWITLLGDGPEDRRPRIRASMASQGFRPTWFSDSEMTCAEAVNGTAYVVSLPKQAAFVRICGADPRWVDTTARQLIESAGLRRGQASPAMASP